MTAALLAIALLVGLSIGMVGVGGVLLPPALHELTALSLHEAMATALFTFIFTGIAGTLLFQRRGSIDWRVATPLCAGGAVFGYVGGRLNGQLDAHSLALVLALLILASGLYALLGRPPAAPRRRGWPLLLVIGSITGLGSGLVGVGGPAVSVPLMVLAGLAPLTAIGASQVIQILAAASGSLAHWHDGKIDLQLAPALAALEVAGVVAGAWLAHAVPAIALRRCVGLLCTVVGVALLLRHG